MRPDKGKPHCPQLHRKMGISRKRWPACRVSNLWPFSKIDYRVVACHFPATLCSDSSEPHFRGGDRAVPPQVLLPQLRVAESASQQKSSRKGCGLTIGAKRCTIFDGKSYFPNVQEGTWSSCSANIHPPSARGSARVSSFGFFFQLKKTKNQCPRLNSFAARRQWKMMRTW